MTAGHTRKEITMPLWFSNQALKVDGLLAVLRLKWVAWALYLHPLYIILNPSGSQAPHPVNFEMSAVASPIGAVMFFFSEESALIMNGPRGQWVNPSALLHSSHAEPSTRPVCRVLFVLCPILPTGPCMVRSAAADSSCLCADASSSVPVRAVRVRRIHGSS